VLTAKEVGDLAKGNRNAYSNRYEERHGEPYSKLGVPTIRLEQVLEHEARWDKIKAAISVDNSPRL